MRGGYTPLPRDRSARWSRGGSRAHVRRRFLWYQGRAWKGRCVKPRVVACSPPFTQSAQLRDVLQDDGPGKAECTETSIRITLRVRGAVCSVLLNPRVRRRI